MKSLPKENADLQAALEENKQNLIAMPRRERKIAA
jgi:hypothetical protein